MAAQEDVPIIALVHVPPDVIPHAMVAVNMGAKEVVRVIAQLDAKASRPIVEVSAWDAKIIVGLAVLEVVGVSVGEVVRVIPISPTNIIWRNGCKRQ